jgi:hypothetical protein
MCPHPAIAPVLDERSGFERITRVLQESTRLPQRLHSGRILRYNQSGGKARSHSPVFQAWEDDEW